MSMEHDKTALNAVLCYTRDVAVVGCPRSCGGAAVYGEGTLSFPCLHGGYQLRDIVGSEGLKLVQAAWMGPLREECWTHGLRRVRLGRLDCGD